MPVASSVVNFPRPPGPVSLSAPGLDPPSNSSVFTTTIPTGSVTFSEVISSLNLDNAFAPVTTSPTPTELLDVVSEPENTANLSLLTTAVVVTGVSSVEVTITRSGKIFTTISASTFTSTLSSVTRVPAPSSPGVLAETKHNNTPTIIGGVISGILGLVIILIAILCFLRRRKRMSRNAVEVPYSPIEPSSSPPVNGQTETRQLPTIRTITPLNWPLDSSHSQSSDALDASVSTAVAPAPSQIAEPASNPFSDPTHVAAATRLIDVSSSGSSRNSRQDIDNPFEDTNNQYWARPSTTSPFDAAYPESEMLHGDGNPTLLPTVTEEKTPTGHARYLSVTSDCPYPVLEPDTLQRPPSRYYSIRSGLSYATLEPDCEKKDDLLSRTPSTSSFNSGSVHIPNTDGSTGTLYVQPSPDGNTIEVDQVDNPCSDLTWIMTAIGVSESPFYTIQSAKNNKYARGTSDGRGVVQLKGRMDGGSQSIRIKTEIWFPKAKCDSDIKWVACDSNERAIVLDVSRKVEDVEGASVKGLFDFVVVDPLEGVATLDRAGTTLGVVGLDARIVGPDIRITGNDGGGETTRAKAF
ncbi:hypothetical protein AN958_10907 [Leucoagaricus sp. SymC.cos]|nr:hypothetical protein AN958_10907 [Leucoagaricus sp. SymC.cos]